MNININININIDRAPHSQMRERLELVGIQAPTNSIIKLNNANAAVNKQIRLAKR